jgi:hypothetical protein
MSECIDCDDGVCRRHRPTHTDMLAFAAAYDEDLRAEGRREMLWLMAVGAAVEAVLAGERLSEPASYFFVVCMEEVSNDALKVLRDLGDQQAALLLGGER